MVVNFEYFDPDASDAVTEIVGKVEANVIDDILKQDIKEAVTR